MSRLERERCHPVPQLKGSRHRGREFDLAAKRSLICRVRRLRNDAWPPASIDGGTSRRQQLDWPHDASIDCGS